MKFVFWNLQLCTANNVLLIVKALQLGNRKLVNLKNKITSL